ncbi:MAG TPA: DUF5103 domain-containing protein [Cyclobacteriaceae bacterium]|nr:DUF5103 domain-containing protein [Cyclobacteriaceae bacterium]
MNPGRLIQAFLIPVLAGINFSAQSSSIGGNQPNKQLLLVDHAYEDNVKTIQLYPAFGARENELLPAVIPLNQPNLQLEFDVLDSDFETYYARLIHCNHDWTKSDLADLDFMLDFNEFPITQYEFSNATNIPYVHYRFLVPRVKLPGNYVLAVYRGSDREDLILTRRFMVYENRISFTRDGNTIGPGQMADVNQQINFTINYKNIEILNPLVDVNVTIRQNNRWDNLLTNLKPSFARENIKELEYRFFDPDKFFKGGNEFRFFDLRSINYPGRNIATVDKSTDPLTAYIAVDKSRHDESYSQYNDMNGNFVIENLDFPDLSASNYAMIHFTLASPKVTGEVYVQGALNQWELNEQNKMTYDAKISAYYADMLLKQGWYDYQYLVMSKNLSPLYFEGSHFQTENSYEIFVYYRPFQPRADLLIGYVKFYTNPR